jgi:DNA invertase Pin-like site-specific DNA recombinase
MRILPVIRLSLATDNTTSPERQFESISRFASYKRHELVEITEADYDLDVSGAVSPFERPGLGRWLREDRLNQWDALCAAKLDRVSRSLFDFTALVHWLEAHGKALIVLDPELDLTTKEGRAMANVLMTFAEYEREVIGARVKDAYDKLIRDGKYTGGMVPFGYMPVKLARNWGYEVDPEYGPLVAEMADRYLRYETLGSIARWLQESGVPSPKDVIRKRNGKPLKGTPWSTAAVRIILSSPAVLGAVTNSKGEPLHDSQGLVIYRAEPLITRDVYERVQARLAQNAVPVRVNSTPLLQVAFCARCGAPMHSTTTNRTYNGKLYPYRYYHCHHANMLDGMCDAKRVRAEPLEEAVFGSLLELAGHRKLRTERLIPGRDYSEESARLIEQTQHIQAEIGRARLQRADYSGLQATLDAANAELDRLAALDPIPARLEYDEIDQTFRQWWELNDQTARNAFMRDQGVKVVVSPDPLPEDLALSRPEMIFSVAIIERPGMHAILYLGNLSDLLRRASELPVTVRES